MVCQYSFTLCPFSQGSLPVVETTDWTVNVVHLFFSLYFILGCSSQVLLLRLLFLPFPASLNIFMSGFCCCCCYCCCFEAIEDNLHHHEFVSTSFFCVLGPISLYLWHFQSDCWTLCMKHYEQSQPHSLASLPLSTSSHVCWWGSQCLDSLLSVTLNHLLATTYLSDSLKQIAFFSFIKWVDVLLCGRYRLEYHS